MSTTPTSVCSLPTRPPYDFGHALTYFTRRAGELVDRAEDGVYRRLFALPQGRFLAEVASGVDGDLVLSASPADEVSSAACNRATAMIAATLTRTLGLDDDLAPIRAAVVADPPLAALVDRYAGLRLISTPSPFEAFVWSVIGQQISLHVAFRLKAALVRTIGSVADVGGSTYYAFPSPEALAAANPDDLVALGLGRRKSATLVTTAGMIADGRLDLDALARLPLDEAEAVLTRLHGVGPWTAHYVLLRGLRMTDACPVSDMGLRVAVGAAYGLGRKASVEEVAACAERWRPYRGYAAFYLWYSLADLGRKGDG
jgi:DNA-3-methyladenine glycosylase II